LFFASLNLDRRRVQTVTTETPTIKAISKAGTPQSNSKFKTMTCYRCLELGHIQKFCRSRVRCARCLELGHIQKFCSGPLVPRPNLQSRAFTTACRPVLVWRPKCNTVDLTDRNLISYPLVSLDSRAKPPEVSPSLATQQEQITPSAAAVPEQPRQSPPLLQKPQSSSPPPIHQTVCAPENTSSIPVSASAMANFPVNPQAFLVAGL